MEVLREADKPGTNKWKLVEWLMGYIALAASHANCVTKNTACLISYTNSKHQEPVYAFKMDCAKKNPARYEI